MTSTFIRIDELGHWKGQDHCSSIQGDGERMESGISCYIIRQGIEGQAVENLRSYWVDIACKNYASEYEGFQVTIFSGEKLEGQGADWEDMAECTETIKTIDAQEFMKLVFDAQEMMDDGEINEEEYLKTIAKLVI